ncbi:hypothetical protein HQN60_06200 [Deefgea piscis]|uniref:Uncharacterized protein n=1 Tax=Deefgea piscis TaxID=2739061 RepID=A0A6M8SX79_9NEIS|nr:hypothetical protein [Deefgea piscis]QKJ66327.1 hypothetical protein HQN60_06200 [Deefgea piscis]
MTLVLPSKELVVYHGTSLSNSIKILKDGFISSKNEDDWLGWGIYFVTDGLSSGAMSAFEWAQFKWPNEELAVVRARIRLTDNGLDLRTRSGLALYNQVKGELIRSEYLSLLARRDLSIKKRKDIRCDDRIITNMVVRYLKCDYIIHNVYIKDKLQSQIQLESAYPNQTLVSLYNGNLIYDVEIMPLSFYESIISEDVEIS